MECKCVTGGLHVGGRCLVCYRNAPAPEPMPCECGVQPVERDGYRVCMNPGCDGYGQVCGPALAAARPDYDPRLDWPERYTDGPI